MYAASSPAFTVMASEVGRYFFAVDIDIKSAGNARRPIHGCIQQGISLPAAFDDDKAALKISSSIA